jgi:nucleoside-diphosphate-sugar epimerase
MRLYQPYGPGQVNRLIPKLVERMLRREAILIQNDDRPHVSPIFIEDVVRVFRSAIERSSSGIFNVAGNDHVSIRELAGKIGQVLGIEPIQRQTGEDCSDAMGDNRLMRQAFGSWSMIALDEGILRAVKKEGAECQARA